ncbi:hypothetical protein Dsin_004081 [Dipteronia sinensis]|uniref:Methionyl/Leucyl tRNA synthetase domain-containing protein n=1 Tax=Dipteronia sinensis TaxID=43782 RepID=A0AAE0BA45_9ROSI|nr:hypothetical protein Dsin_004081 [Dipteronia sinensis]
MLRLMGWLGLVRVTVASNGEPSEPMVLVWCLCYLLCPLFLFLCVFFCCCCEPTDPFVLTTPLYYVNAPPHMGSAYTTIAADAIARFQRLLGKKVIFITGTDEHGEKIAAAAAASGSSPSEHCDVISQSYKTLWKDLDIAYDKFIRTTDPKHEGILF